MESGRWGEDEVMSMRLSLYFNGSWVWGLTLIFEGAGSRILEGAGGRSSAMEWAGECHATG